MANCGDIAFAQTAASGGGNPFQSPLNTIVNWVTGIGGGITILGLLFMFYDWMANHRINRSIAWAVGAGACIAVAAKPIVNALWGGC